MFEIPLNALSEELFPVSYLSALGVIAVLQREGLTSYIKWRHDPYWSPVLISPIEFDEVATALRRGAAARESELTQTTTNWLEVADMRQILDDTRFRRNHGWWWPGLFTEWPIMDTTGREKPKNESEPKPDLVRLSQIFSVHPELRDKLFSDILPRLMRKTCEKPDAFQECLLTRWRNEDYIITTEERDSGGGVNDTTFGWGSVDAAASSQEPELLRKTSTAAALWLVLEGMSFFPTWAVEGNKARTAGVIRRARTLGQDSRMMWLMPLWENPLTLPTIRRVVFSMDVTHENSWRERGIVGLYACDLISENKRMILGRPYRVW